MDLRKDNETSSRTSPSIEGNIQAEVLREIEAGRRHDELWNKALAECDGNLALARSRYVQLRVDGIKHERFPDVLELTIDSDPLDFMPTPASSEWQDAVPAEPAGCAADLVEADEPSDTSIGKPGRTTRGLVAEPIDNTEREAVLCSIRQLFSDGSSRDRDTALRELARALGYRRLGAHIREVLSKDFMTAVRRGILENDRGMYKIGFRSLEECSRSSLKADFLSAVGRAWIDRVSATRAFARFLGFSRVGDVIDETARSLISGLIREKRLEVDGSGRIRRVR